MCVGGGPFGFEESIDATGSPALSFWALVLMALLWALPQAVVISELSTRYNFGYTQWVLAGLGDVVGTAHGWIRAACNLLTNITYASLFGDYFLPIALGDASYSLSFWRRALWRFVALAPYVALILAGNLSGIRLVGWASIVLTVVIMSPFLVMFAMVVHKLNIGSLFDFSPPQRNLLSSSASSASNNGGLFGGTSWGLLVSVLVFNLIGWDDVGNLSNRVRKVERDIPLGIFVCLVIILVTYSIPLLIVATVVKPSDYGIEMYVTAAEAIWHPLRWVVSVDALIGIFGLGFVYLTTSSEAQAHSSVLGLLPSFIATRSRRALTPWVAMVGQSAVVFAASLFLTFDIAVEIQSWMYTFSTMLIILSFLRIRWRTRSFPKEQQEFRIGLPFWGLIIFAAPVICLCIVCMAASSWKLLLCLVAVVVVLLALAAVLRWKKVLLPQERIYGLLSSEEDVILSQRSTYGGLLIEEEPISPSLPPPPHVTSLLQPLLSEPKPPSMPEMPAPQEEPKKPIHDLATSMKPEAEVVMAEEQPPPDAVVVAQPPLPPPSEEGGAPVPGAVDQQQQQEGQK